MRLFERLRRQQLAVVSILALAFACAYVVQPAWDNELAHYDLTRALVAGSPTVDGSFRHPKLRTIDVTRRDGHVYAAKMPGFAAANVPAYLVARAVGAKTTSAPRGVVWGLHLWGVVLPATLLLVLVRRRVDQITPGLGTAVAVSLGAATLILPFSTVFFSHVLSALLGFSAYLLVARERESVSSRRLLFAAGLLAGLGCVVEYSLAIVALALGIIVVLKQSRLRRGAAYAAGVVLGAIPAFAFNYWAFRSPFHFAYQGWHAPGEKPLPGVLGIKLPTAHNLIKVVFYPGGIGPALALGILGAVLLWRSGRRVEAVLPMALIACFALSDAASSTPFGGVSPGPRYIIPALPFLAVPVAAAFSSFPGLAAGLVGAGGAYMAAATMTGALEAWDGLVWHRVMSGDYVDTVARFAGVHSAAAIIPFVVALFVAIAAAAAATSWRHVHLRDVIAAPVAFGAWLLVATHTPSLLAHGLSGEAAVLGAAAVAIAVVVGIYTGGMPIRPRSVGSSPS